MFFTIPASLFVLSCGMLFMCSRILNVDNSGHMNMKCCTHDAMGSNLQFKDEGDADTL